MFSDDAILQAIGNIVGGAVGAFLGGLFAVNVMKKQMEFQVKKRKEEREENFEKTHWLLLTAFKGVGEAINKVDETLNNPAIINPNYAYLIGVLDGAMTSANEDLNMVNDNFIPKEIYPKYLRGKKILRICEFNIDRLSKEYFSNKEEFIIDKNSNEFQALYENSPELESILKEISDFKSNEL